MSIYAPKSFAEILSVMVAHARASTERITDYNIGSVTRSWLEAAALGLDEAWYGVSRAISEAIPEAVFLAFDFSRLPAEYALGEVTFYTQAPAGVEITVSAGSAVRKLGSPIGYTTLADAIIGVGETSATAPVRADLLGADANVAANELTVYGGQAGVYVTNAAPIQSGSNEETDAERTARFADFIEALSRGTVAALRYAARLAYLEDGNGAVTERCLYSGVDEDLPGRVRLWVHNGSGNTSQALADRVSEIIEGTTEPGGGVVPGYRAAGVQVICQPMVDVDVDIEVNATLLSGYTQAQVQEQAEIVLDSLMRNLLANQVIVPAIVTALYSVPGILNLEMVDPLSALTLEPNERPVFGTLTLNWQ
jgi:uncharacterized phage protein gp47/JayE